MLFVRSVFFHILFYLNFFAHAAMTPIALLTPSHVAWLIGSNWMTRSIDVWRFSTGSKIEVRGLENIPEGGFIIASKHQSTWETLGLAKIFGRITYIMKRELMNIPIFGWFCAKAKMIPIDRGSGSKVIKPMTEKAREAVNEGRNIVIFMEGTRVPAGGMLPYKVGVARLYGELQCPIVPIALNTGLFWPRNSFWRYSGKVIVEILPPIMPGLRPKEALARLEKEVEDATNRLLIETAQSPEAPETVDAALERLKARGVEVTAPV